jgi:hypothetical protein
MLAGGGRSFPEFADVLKPNSDPKNVPHRQFDIGQWIGIEINLTHIVDAWPRGDIAAGKNRPLRSRAGQKGQIGDRDVPGRGKVFTRPA